MLHSIILYQNGHSGTESPQIVSRSRRLLRVCALFLLLFCMLSVRLRTPNNYCQIFLSVSANLYMPRHQIADWGTMTASAMVSRRKVLFKSAVREGLFSFLCRHERGGLLCAPVAIHTAVLREPVIQQQQQEQRRACVRACARGYGGMPEVDLGDPACPSPAPTAKIAAAGGPAGRRGGGDARRRLYSSNLCRARFIWTARRRGGDEQVGTARVLRAAVLYLSSRSGL